MLKKALEDVLTTEESEELISAFDQIGEIAIIDIKNEILNYKNKVGDSILEFNTKIRSVFGRTF